MARPKFRLGLRTVKTALAVIISLFVASLFGELSIFPIQVSHSVPDSFLYVLNTNDGAIVFTGNYVRKRAANTGAYSFHS